MKLNFKNKYLLIIIFCLFPAIILAQVNWTFTKIGTAYWSTRPSIASDPLGNIHVAWSDGDPYGELVQYVSNQHHGWNFQQKAGGVSGNQCYLPTVTADNEGFVHIATRYEYSRANYITNHLETGWRTTTAIYATHCHETGIEVDSDYNPYIFIQDDSKGQNIYYQDYNTTVIPFDSLSPGGPVKYYSTAIDSNDILHFVVGCYKVDDTLENIYYTSFQDGVWGDAIKIDQINNYGVGQPSIAIGPDNHAHIVFMNYGDGSGEDIFYTNNVNGTWSEPINVSNSMVTSDIYPSLAVDENGKAHIVWIDLTSNAVLYTNNVNGIWLSPSSVTLLPISYDQATTHVDHKIALDSKSNTVFIPYTDGTDVYVATTSDFCLRKTYNVDTTNILIASNNLIEPDTINSVIISEDSALDVFDFTISDVGGDGLSTKIKKIIVQVGPNTTTNYTDPITGNKNSMELQNVLAGAVLRSSSGDTVTGTIYESKIVFKLSNSVWTTVSNGSSKTFTMSVWLNSPIPNGLDGSVIDFKINGLYDVVLDKNSSIFAYTNSDILSGSITVSVVPANFEFTGLINNFYNENLIHYSDGKILLVGKYGSLANNVNSFLVTLSAVETDCNTLASGVLTSDNGLSYTLNNGFVAINDLKYSKGDEILIKISSNLLTTYTDCLTILPYNNALLLEGYYDVGSTYTGVFPGIKYDKYHPFYLGTTDSSKLANYSTIIIASPEYQDFSNVANFEKYLNGGTEDSLKSMLVIGEHGLSGQYYKSLSENYLGATFPGTETSSALTAVGIASDPISDEISTSIDPAGYNYIKYLENNPTQVNAKPFLKKSSSGDIIGIRNNTNKYRTVFMTINLNDFTNIVDRDTLISRIFRWFKSDISTQGPIFIQIPTIDMQEDSVFKFSITDWYDFVSDGDTPDSLLNWNFSSGNNITINLTDKMVSINPDSNFYGVDSVNVFVSDGSLSDSIIVRINVNSINDSPEPFTLLLPEDNYIETKNENIQFDWSSSFDIESDSILYLLHFYNDLTDTLIVTDTSMFELCPEEFGFHLDTLINWTVIATDLNDSTEASNAPFHFKISPDVAIKQTVQFPDEYVLLQNYPNPFNPITTIKYSIPERSFVQLIIFDLQGNTIASLVNESQKPGWYRYQWDGTSTDGTSVSSGIYFCRIKSDSFFKVIKMIFLK